MNLRSKWNEFESMEIVLENDAGCAEVLNAADLDEEFDEEDVNVGFVPFIFTNEVNIPVFHTDGVPRQPFVCIRCNQFYKYQRFYQKQVESCGK